MFLCVLLAFVCVLLLYFSGLMNLGGLFCVLWLLLRVCMFFWRFVVKGVFGLFVCVCVFFVSNRLVVAAVACVCFCW